MEYRLDKYMLLEILEQWQHFLRKKVASLANPELHRLAQKLMQY